MIVMLKGPELTDGVSAPQLSGPAQWCSQKRTAGRCAIGVGCKLLARDAGMVQRRLCERAPTCLHAEERVVMDCSAGHTVRSAPVTVQEVHKRTSASGIVGFGGPMLSASHGIDLPLLLNLRVPCSSHILCRFHPPLRAVLPLPLLLRLVA
jgi:hypothetical protein